MPVTDFTWYGFRIATSMDHLTPADREQWKAALLDNDVYLEGVTDYFDKTDDNLLGYNDEIYIEYWLWKSPEGTVLLKDMFSWPGDNQSGGVFISVDPTPILVNGDCDIACSSADNLTDLQAALQTDIDSFIHIRSMTSGAETCDCEDGHDNCTEQWRLRKEACPVHPVEHEELDEFLIAATKCFDDSHNHNHANAVFRNVLRIIESDVFPMPIEFDVVTHATKLHDVNDLKYPDSIGEAAVVSYLDRVLGEEKRKRVMRIIENVSWSKESKGKTETLPEPDQTYLTILRDADRIEALGEIGLERCIQFTQSRGGKVPEDVIQHCHDKLLRLYNDNFIRTRTGRMMAEPGHLFLEEWVRGVN